MSISSFLDYLKGRSAIIHEKYVNLKYNYGNQNFGIHRYYVIMVDLN
nr:hypothetical protein [Lentilactobacillus hilgardii]